MRRKYLDILRCPVSQEPLTFKSWKVDDQDPNEILDGLFVAESSGYLYALWKGVPRLLPPEMGMPPAFLEKYQDRRELLTAAKREDDFSFSAQWSMYEYSELTWELDVDQRLDYFYYYIDKTKADMQGKWVFDAGCGNGTLSAAIAKSGLTVVAMDFSSAMETAEQHKKRFGGEGWENILYIQGDVQQPPFAPKQFDVIYSDGVLHHTPETRRSFHAIRQCLKDEGRMFVWLYRSDLKLKYLLKEYAVDMIRIPMTPLPVPVKRALCFVMACTLLTWLRILRAAGLGGRRIIPLRQKTVNLFDTFTPSFNHRHTPPEVTEWFSEEGFSNVVERTIPAIGNVGFGVLGSS